MWLGGNCATQSNLPSCEVARRPLCHKVNLPRCEARRRHFITTSDIFGTGKKRGGSPGKQGAGGVRETGEERAGSGISTMAGSGREKKKASFRYLLLLTSSQRNEPNNLSWLPFNVLRGLKQNLYARKVKKRKLVLGIKKNTNKNDKKQHYFLWN